MAKRKQQQQQRPRIVEHVDSDDDEEIDEDEAFNSEDERRYGSFFSSKNSNKEGRDEESEEDSDDIASSDDSSEEGDGGQYMLDLLNKLDSATTAETPHALASHLKESEFSSSVVTSTLTMDALMNGLQDTHGFGKMQSTMDKLSKGRTTSTPVARIVSDRAQRKVHYEDSTEQVTQWIDAVQENRQAETLDFRPRGINVLSKHALVGKFKPTTDFEKELAEALTQAGQQDEASMLKAEQQMMDDLGNNEITMEAYKERRGELAKLRALMFYHEQKRHHMNKIKSKKYRRIRKKQRERAKDGELEANIQDDPTLQQELDEKEELDRMRERASLAHKNTSKWAKRILKRGKHVDQDTRRALSAQLKRGEDLRNKMNGTGDSDDDGDENEDLVETAKRILQETEGEAISAKQSKGLFALSFMQKGVEKQRQQAKEEARILLQELEANAQHAGADEQSEVEQKPKRAKKASSAEEIKHILGDGKLVATSLDFGNSNSISVSGGINIDLGSGRNSENGDVELSSRTRPHTSTFEVSVQATDTEKIFSKATDEDHTNPVKKNASSSTFAMTKMNEDESNPWLAATNDSNTAITEPRNKKKRKTSGFNKKGVVDVVGAVDLFTDNLPMEAHNKATKGKPSTNSTNIASLTQEELVRRAFSAPTDTEVEEDFAKEKAEAMDRDDPTRTKKDVPKTSNGWGSWAGAGAPPSKPPRKIPKKLQAPENALPKRKRADDKKPLVIINEKRIKKTAGSFQIANIPYPYTSRQEYERAMTGAVGKEWNVTSAVKNMTRPEIITRAGKMIQPLSKRVKAPRPAAKF